MGNLFLFGALITKNLIEFSYYEIVPRKKTISYVFINLVENI